MSALPMTASELAAELAVIAPSARVFAVDPEDVRDLVVTRVSIRGGDVYLETEEDPE